MLQNLLFLVRDWADLDFEYGFRGGDRVLAKVLQVQRKHKDLESVRKSIHDSFKSVKCFLMPYPGPTIAVRKAASAPPSLQG